MAAYAWHFYSENSVIQAHQGFLQRMQDEDNYLILLHPGIYWLSLLTARLTGLDALQAMHIWLSLHAAALPLVLVAVLRWLDTGPASRGVLLGGALMAMLAGSIPLPLVDVTVYNYAHINRSFLLLRNATHTAMLPYGIAAFGLLARIIAAGQRNVAVGKGQYAALALLLLASALMKPSLAVALIPAAGLYLRVTTTLPPRPKLLLVAAMAPAALLVLLQFTFGFLHNPSGSSVIHLQFDLLRVWRDNNMYPLLSCLLATAFPLWMLWCRRPLSMPARIAWAAFTLSLIPYVMLGEVADISTSSDRDFEWSYLHTRQLVFIACIAEWWRWLREEHSRPASAALALRPLHIATLLLLAHAVSGYVRMVVVDVN